MGEKRKEFCLLTFPELSMDMLSEDNVITLGENDDLLNELGMNEDSNILEDSEFEEKEDKTTEEVDPNGIFESNPESVGSNKESQESEEEDTSSVDETSPNSDNNLYATVAQTLYSDGILSTLDEDKIKEITDADSIVQAIKDDIEERTLSRFSEQEQRIIEALNNNVEPDIIKQYEKSIHSLENLKEEQLIAESDEGENLRKQLIYQDYINRGFKPERAKKEVEKSINGGDDIEDAKLALESLKEDYKTKYQDILDEAKQEAENNKKLLEEHLEKFKKTVMETEEPIPGFKVDSRLRKTIYDNATKPVYSENGRNYSKFQKFIKDDPLKAEYLFNVLFSATEGFKSFDKLISKSVKATTKEATKKLAKVIENSSRTTLDVDNSSPFGEFNEDDAKSMPILLNNY